MRIIDLSHTINETMPIYPGTKPPRLEHDITIAQAGYNETWLQMYSHTGTHIDAPSHILPQGKNLDDFPASQFFGMALIVDFPSCAGNQIELPQLQLIENRIALAEFLLFHTRQYQLWGQPAYFENYQLLTPQAAEYLTTFPLKGIGFDTISVDAMGSDYPIHEILLSKNDRILIENLCNFAEVRGDFCMFSALPLKYEKADGSPTRAIAIELETSLPQEDDVADMNMH